MKPEVRSIAQACEAVMGFFFPDSTVTVGEVHPVSDKFSAEARVVVLGVEGSWRGNLVLSFPEDSIPVLAEKFLGMTPPPGLEEATDEVLLELGNQIAARACRELEEAKLGTSDLTPPSLLFASGPLKLAWNLPKASLLRVSGGAIYFDVAVGLAAGPTGAAP